MRTVDFFSGLGGFTIGAQRAGLKPVLLDPEGLFPEAECSVIRSLSELKPGSA